MPGKNSIQPRDMQDFLDALSRCEADRENQQAKRDFVRCFAELQFCMHGGSKCAVCRAHVRHVLPVYSERTDQSVRNFECLCTRCFEGERGAAKKLCMKLGETTIHFEADGTLVFEEPHPDSLRRTTLMCF
jgi:hypothetical protein